MKNFKLIAIDMDGTLLNDDLEISKRNRDTIKKLINMGKLVVLATGRTFRSANYYAKQLELDLPIITYNGALIKETISKDILYSKKIEVKHAKNLLKLGEKYDIYTKVYIDDVLFVENECDEAKTFSKRHRINYRCIGNLSEKIGEAPYLVVFKDSIDKINVVKDKIEKELKLPISYTMSTPTSLEFMAKGVSKASSLERLSNKLSINRDETLAIGNSLNDLEMLKWAGLGIAMKNSDDSLLDEWKNVSELDNNDDGVSHILNSFCFIDET
ncbi:Cof-type HAD-IIB family hydrolase [Maledivibacter halophilus]|uniref:Cof subfamily of IIB subfamily of haloacid dehalogenase superfamily/HAD-superfamily hydrolase, subfamily IIB n=1 Tax=Maledivibacter halophilus TaxID=36842 RepID=A0A1T5MEG9_9FIRM|nr:Cof-type HAD-IIB family hydrolase [Maledivibacter halophilus]SKC86279.1 hypothetical protein SAMN02194393_04503 [Maledivibacter halophilus]